MSYINIGAKRFFASAPTLDTERASPFSVARYWIPSHIEIFGHSIDIDVPTGNLIVSTTEVTYPYYNFSLGISRKYDIQEQHMQLSYLRNYPNVNPKPHWFGNWQLAYEADVDEVWHNSFPELHVTSGVGANGLFEIKRQDFRRTLKDGTLTKNVLRSYGIPGRTLAELNWKFTENDSLLRTLRGTFQILSGHFREETVVDDIDAEMWLFNPISGSAFHISSEFFYNIPGEKYRDVGYPLIVTKLVDALGHAIELKPSGTAPPFKRYILSDGSGREFYIDLNEEITFLDGLNSGGEVRKYLVSKVTDGTKTNYNVFDYKYNTEHLLEEIIFPSSIGNRYIKYYYEDSDHPGVLTAIENSYGHKIHFEYMEDPTDNDERLNPRLKIKKVTDPEGITFEYEYNYTKSEVTITISENGTIDRKVKYNYIRDIHNTKQRYISLTEIEVRRGYVTNEGGNVVPRQPNNPQIIQNRTEYTEDGRFKIHKEFDPLNRETLYNYNDFNQLKKKWGWKRKVNGAWKRPLTEYEYDIHDSPIRYDLLIEKRNNLIREKDPNDPGNFIETVKDVIRNFEYAKYDDKNSNDLLDHGKQSTHRVTKETDERNEDWGYLFVDSNNHNPLSPTLIETPLGNKQEATYNNRGEIVTKKDINSTANPIEVYEHKFEYYDQGLIKKYTDPNGGEIELTYEPCGNWVKTFSDRLTNITSFERYVDGKIKVIEDPEHDKIEYQYFSNERLKEIEEHRPPIPDLGITPSPDDQKYITKFHYTPLGKMCLLKNQKNLALKIEYDEVGRVFHWYHDVPPRKYTKFLYDMAGQLTQFVNKDDKMTLYTYYDCGFVETINYPSWNDGADPNKPGKQVKYHLYDFQGRVLTIEDSEIGTREAVFDEAGNIILRRDPNGFQLEFIYDKDNRLKKVEDSANNFLLDLTLDSLGRPSKLRDSNVLDEPIEWKYYYTKAVGGITKVLNLYKVEIPNINLDSSFDYDANDRLGPISHQWTDAGAQLIFSQEVKYRDDDLIREITGDDVNKFRYDGIKRLIFEQLDNCTTDYDKAGNRLYRVNKNNTPNPDEDEYTGTNRIIEEKENLHATFTHDDVGNIVRITTPTEIYKLHFDGINRLRIFRKENEHVEIRYTYDIEGRIVERVVEDLNNGDIETTKFNYLFTKPIVLERDGHQYMILTWDPRGMLLRVRREQSYDAGWTYKNSLFPLYDGLGNIVRFMSSEKDEKVKIIYNSWGDINTINDPDGLFEFWGYKNGIVDIETNFILFGERWYFPKIGRWISEDPLPSMLGEKANQHYEDLINLYAHLRNNPINRVDINGLWVVAVGIKSTLGVSGLFEIRENSRFLVFDDYGNVGIMTSTTIASVSHCGVSLGSGLNVRLYPTTDSIYDLEKTWSSKNVLQRPSIMGLGPIDVRTLEQESINIQGESRVERGFELWLLQPGGLEHYGWSIRVNRASLEAAVNIKQLIEDQK